MIHVSWYDDVLHLRGLSSLYLQMEEDFAVIYLLIFMEQLSQLLHISSRLYETVNRWAKSSDVKRGQNNEAKAEAEATK